MAQKIFLKYSQIPLSIIRIYSLTRLSWTFNLKYFHLLIFFWNKLTLQRFGARRNRENVTQYAGFWQTNAALSVIFQACIQKSVNAKA